MRALTIPFAFGLSACVLTALALWFAVPLVMTPFGAGWIAWFPLFVVLPPLLVGGFVAARKARSRHLLLYLPLGGVVGIAAMLLFILVSRFSGVAWARLLIILGGGSVSAIGALFGARKQNAL